VNEGALPDSKHRRAERQDEHLEREETEGAESGNVKSLFSPVQKHSGGAESGGRNHGFPDGTDEERPIENQETDFLNRRAQRQQRIAFSCLRALFSPVQKMRFGQDEQDFAG